MNFWKAPLPVRLHPLDAGLPSLGVYAGTTTTNLKTSEKLLLPLALNAG